MAEGRTTRDRILDAAFESLAEDGTRGTTARSIAARGGFNQALIFYHFGSLNALLAEAARRGGRERVELMRADAEGVEGLPDVVDLARKLHGHETQARAVTVVTQMMAAARGDPELGAAVLEGFEEWIDLIEEVIRRGASDSPLAPALPPRETAWAVSAMFLGIELLSRLDPERSETEAVFDALEGLARVAEGLADMIPAPLRPVVARLVERRRDA